MMPNTTYIKSTLYAHLIGQGIKTMFDFWTDAWATLIENKITPSCSECGQFISRYSVLHGLVIIGDVVGLGIENRTYTHLGCYIHDED